MISGLSPLKLCTNDLHPQQFCVHDLHCNFDYNTDVTGHKFIDLVSVTPQNCWVHFLN